MAGRSNRQRKAAARLPFAAQVNPYSTNACNKCPWPRQGGIAQIAQGIVCNLGRQFVCFSSSMKIALAQFNPTVGDFAGNSARILSLSAEAYERGAGLVVFSELCLCGYFPLDLLERPALLTGITGHLKELGARIPGRRIVGSGGGVKKGQGRSLVIKAGWSAGGGSFLRQGKCCWR